MFLNSLFDLSFLMNPARGQELFLSMSAPHGQIVYPEAIHHRPQAR